LTQKTETVTVINADDMAEDTFRKHMSIRHATSLGGFRGLPPFRSDYVEECWRTFHDTLHRLGLQLDMDHEHGA